MTESGYEFLVLYVSDIYACYVQKDSHRKHHKCKDETSKPNVSNVVPFNIQSADGCFLAIVDV